MKQINLVNTTLTILVDDEDYIILNKHIWYLKKNHGNYYARTFINGKSIYMHQILCPSVSLNLTPDHKNRNGLDNQKENLRLLTQTQQNLNKPKRERFAQKGSRYKGVYFESRTGKWFASISLKGKSKHLGTFNTEVGAGRAYNKAAIEAHGEHAVLNEFNEPL